jgi:MFS family permease
MPELASTSISGRSGAKIPNWSGAGRVTGGIVVAVLFMGSTLLTPLYDLYRTAYGFSSLVLVLLYAVYVIGNLLALLVFGRLSDQIGRKPLVFAALALSASSAAAFLFARSLVWLFAARIVSGLAVGIGSGAATAWITEFTRPERRARSATLMTGFNFVGLALGPLLAGALVEYASHPFRVPFGAYLVILAIAALLVVTQPETLSARSKVRFAAKLGVPEGARAAFVAPAAAGFAAMAVVGFYAALGPTTIQLDLHVTNRAVASAMVAGLFVLGAILIFVTPAVPARRAMLAGLAATPIGMALLVYAQRSASLPAFLFGTAACAVAGALGYRGGLSVANGLAPPERRAEIASAFFICCFCGNALPIIGLGALTQATSRHLADAVFAGVVSGIALIAWIAAFIARADAEVAPR